MTLQAFLTRLIWLCVLPLVLLAVYLAGNHLHSIQTRQDQEARNQARNIATALDRNLWARISAWQMLAASPFADEQLRLGEFYREAQGFRATFGGHVILADVSMQMLCNTRAPLGTPLPKLPQPKGFAAAPAVLASGKPAVGDMFLGPIAKEPLIAVVVPVVRQGRTRALLLNTIEARLFQQCIEQVALPDGWSLALLDSTNSVIARRPPPADLNANAGEAKRFAAPLAISRWSVALEIPHRISRAPLIATATACAMAILAFTLISVLGGQWASRRLTRSMRTLTQTAASSASPHPAITEIETVRTLLRESESRLRATFAQAEEAARQSKERLHRFIEANIVGVVVASPSGSVIEANDCYLRIIGYTRQEFEQGLVDWRAITPPEWLPADEHAIGELRGRGACTPYEKEYVRRDGTRVAVFLTDVMLPGPEEEIAALVLDITERKKLEAQYLQAQKMESIGRLAGGVAHDFNNMLQTIVGYSDLALTDLPADSPYQENFQEISKAARRATDLTRQLLAFARRQEIQPRVLVLDEAVAGMTKMLKRLIGEDIDLAWRPGTPGALVRMDPSQIDQILANLVVNARDAIGGPGGGITIETAPATLDGTYCANHPGARAGSYLCLTVSDNGCGMERETLARVFEPFFTTKEQGKGTGLGLATVYGIVKQNNGFVNAYSEPGQGTTFRLYLPRHQETGTAAGPLPAKTFPAAIPGGNETIMLVEDDEALLGLAQTVLANLGYTVLSATTPRQALQVAGRHDGAIHLLLTDMVLPGMNGGELARELTTSRPGLRCLFMSGYTADRIAHQGVLEIGSHFLQKPFATAELAAMVREALTAATTNPPPSEHNPL